jgi:hypothetical protein
MWNRGRNKKSELHETDSGTQEKVIEELHFGRRSYYRDMAAQ